MKFSMNDDHRGLHAALERTTKRLLIILPFLNKALLFDHLGTFGHVSTWSVCHFSKNQ
jgi:hypothetical protein